MNNTILGVDLGTNSIGWAIRDTLIQDNQITHRGVLTFSKGVTTIKGVDFPKVQKRTQSRGIRRNYQAEKYRKYNLLQFLIEKDMCPLSIEELDRWRKYTRGKKREYPQSEVFIQWLRFDFNGDGKPDFHLFDKDKNESYYIFRTNSINEDKKQVFDNNSHILGRVFYQLAQRRGFRGRDGEEAKTMLTGSKITGTEGRDEIANYIDEHKTLGAALYHYQKENGGRIRQRYNLRKDYENELIEICKTHRINNEDYKRLWKAIIWQRPLRTQKGLVGICIYERNKKRAPISHPLYEEFRTWVFINNLKIEPPKGKERATYLKEKIYPIFNKTANEFELKSILNQLEKDGAIMNSNFRDKTKVISAKLQRSFQDTLGKDWKDKYAWEDIHDRSSKPIKKNKKKYTFEDVWHVLNTFDGQESLYKFAIENLNLSNDKADRFSKIKLNQGYATISLSAIKKILPFLHKGFLYSQAVYLANLYKVLGKESMTEELFNEFTEKVSTIINDNTEQRVIHNIVNSLINDELEDEHQYSIETERDLDKSEEILILDKVIYIYGEKTWGKLDKEEQLKIIKSISKDFKDFLEKPIYARQDAFIKQPKLQDQIWEYIVNTYKVPNESKKHLWHPSEQEKYVSALEYQHFKINEKSVYISENKIESFVTKNPNAEYQELSLKLLGSPEPISRGFKNPMALKTLHKLRQLINYLLQNEIMNHRTRIVIEIARELNDTNKRKAIENWNRAREEENKKHKKIIQEINKECNTYFDENDKTLLKRIRLWEEQGRMCLYTGKMISLSDMFNGVLYDIEHTIPASMSFDSELKNLTLADANYNRNIKGKLLPTQLVNYSKPAKIDRENYPSITSTIEQIFGKRSVNIKVDKRGNETSIVSWRKIEELNESFIEWKNKAAFASTKERKDDCIQKYHFIKMKLDYLKAKLHTFTMEEYKLNWKNSQLRDTQIATKYALPYLKTVFNKVSVEKAEVVHAFKEIFQIKLPFDKKNRMIHSHHAIDAAILTLIPPFFERDIILQKYNEEKDKKTGTVYHEKPKDWSSFSASKILSIENKILINNLSENRTTLSTYKRVRKKGKLEYIRYKDKNGKWHRKLDNNGEEVVKIAQGDTIRGQLHEESFYGAIKQPIRDENNKILFDENKNMQLHEDVFIVMRQPLIYNNGTTGPGFKTLEAIEKVIVDKDLFKMIKRQVENSDIKTALEKGVYMLDKQGNKVNKIRRIRCKVNQKYNSLVKVHTHAFTSNKDYKIKTLARNGDNTLCLLYMNDKDKAMNIQSISQVAESGIKNDKYYFEEPFYNRLEKGKMTIPLHAILRSEQKTIFFKESVDELKELSEEELSLRLFKISKFELDGRISFKHHLAAGKDTELKKIHKEVAYFNPEEKPVFLRLTKKHWNFAIEGEDFEITLDGKIDFTF